MESENLPEKKLSENYYWTWKSFSYIIFFTKQMKEWEDKLKELQEEIRTDSFREVDTNHKIKVFWDILLINKLIEEQMERIENAHSILEECLKEKDSILVNLTNDKK